MFWDVGGTIEMDITYQGKGNYWELVGSLGRTWKKREDYALPSLTENINVIS